MFCLGHCAEAVSVQMDQGEIYSVSGTNARNFFNEEVLTRLNEDK